MCSIVSSWTVYVKFSQLLQSPFSWKCSISRLHALSLSFSLCRSLVFFFAHMRLGAMICCCSWYLVFARVLNIHVLDKQTKFGATAAAVAAVVDALHATDEICCRVHVVICFSLFIRSLTLFSQAFTFSPFGMPCDGLLVDLLCMFSSVVLPLIWAAHFCSKNEHNRRKNMAASVFNS